MFSNPLTVMPLTRSDKQVLNMRILTTREEVEQVISNRVQLYAIYMRSASAAKDGYALGYFKIRTNGALKTWKTRPNEWSLPCKYGLKDCFRLSNSSNLNSGGVLAVEVSSE